MSTTSEELKKLYKKLGGDEENIRKASTPAEILNGINELDIGSAIMSDAKIEDLKDVEIVSPVKGETIEFDGEKWVNVDKPDMSVVKSVSGNPVEFNDGANAPLVKCVSAITGSQDLHGYDKPWVGGAGKNKLSLTVDILKTLNIVGSWSGNVYTSNDVKFVVLTDKGGNVIGITFNGTASGDIAFALGNSSALTDGTGYIFTSGNSSASTSTFFINIAGVGSDGQQISFTASSGISNPRLYIRSGITVTNQTLYPMIRLATVSDPTFAPYSNICPITAYTEGKIEVGEKDLVEHYGRGVYFASDGHFSELQAYTTTDKINIVGGETYTLSMSNKGTDNAILFWNGDTYLGKSSSILFDDTQYTFTTPNNATLFIFETNVSVGNMSFMKLYKGTELPTTHTTTFSSAIYRGSEDVVNGGVECIQKKLTISSNVQMIASYGYDNAPLFYYFVVDSNDVAPYCINTDPIENKLISNFYTVNTMSTSEGMKDFEMRTNSLASTNHNAIYWRDSRFSSAADINTYIANNPIEIVYRVYPSPTTSSVTPTNAPVKSLNGYSNIESSTGEMEIDYINGEYDPLIQAMSKQVVANPTDAASETLTGLKVGDTTYSVPQGGGGSIQRMLMNNTITIE